MTATEQAPTPGQAAYAEWVGATGPHAGKAWKLWDQLRDDQRELWERIARAAIAAALPESVKAALDEIAAQEPQPTAGVDARKLEIALTALDEIHVAHPTGTHAHDTAHAAMDRMSALPADDAMPAPGAISTSFTWDYRQPAPMDEIAVRVRELSGGIVTMSMPETGSDEYELVITRHEPEPAREPAAAMREARGYREALQQIARNDGFDLARDHNAKIARRALEGK